MVVFGQPQHDGATLRGLIGNRSNAGYLRSFLLIDAAQGIEAQTLANLYLALENDLAIIPVELDANAVEPLLRTIKGVTRITRVKA